MVLTTLQSPVLLLTLRWNVMSSRNASRKKVFVSGMLRVFHLVLRCCPVDGESTILLETSPDESK